MARRNEKGLLSKDEAVRDENGQKRLEADDYARKRFFEFQKEVLNENI